MKYAAVRIPLLVAAVMFAPAAAQAGPPLICHPFETAGAVLLPWGSGPGWNTPDPAYDVRRLTADTLHLLSSDAPILARMEILRRAVIYASRDARVADQLLSAVLARPRPDGAPHALFEAGYLIESFKQAAHLHGRSVTSADGYAMVLDAIRQSDTGAAAEMEFAAALMSEGATYRAHMARARSRAAGDSILARNIASIDR